MIHRMMPFFAATATFFVLGSQAGEPGYWNAHSCLTVFRLPPAPSGYSLEYLDLNEDGRPDGIRTVTVGDVPVLWLDDDGNMEFGATEGDMVNDCLLLDRNRDGIYDFIVKWADQDGDGHADLQLVADYPLRPTDAVWPHGHYMIVLDTDRDNIFNYIDWNTFRLESWRKSGICDFYPDYSGQTAFLKMHASTDKIGDLRLNWENPFLFYDPDRDGLTEIAVRLLDSPPHMKNDSLPNTYDYMQLTGRIDWVSIAVDLDNDNSPGNEFDFDFTLGFQGEGFDYSDQRHPLRNMRGLPEADRFFPDPRIRQLKELVYADHAHARDLIFGRGEWSRVNFVYDEDDDCGRWERVEFCEDRDPFRVGSNNGGFDNHTQSDASGDRGEWDTDNSGGGKLYVSRFDGRLHLYGAERGIWRIDQNANYYQGWDRLWLRRDPERFATVRYTDRDCNGFFDFLEYDLDGDGKFETTTDLHALGLDDRCELIDVSKYSYRNYRCLMRRISNAMWRRAEQAVIVAEYYGIHTVWYAKLKQAFSERERYHKGYWLQYYLYRDLAEKFSEEGRTDLLLRLHTAYHTAEWNQMLGK